MNKFDKPLWKEFSEYIRRRDALKFSYGNHAQCVTCPHRGHWKNFDCGHFMSRRHLSTKFNEQNVAAQCKGCNGLGAGKQYEFGLAIDKRWGKGTADRLLIKSKQMAKWTDFDYQELIKHYRKENKRLGGILG